MINPLVPPSVSWLWMMLSPPRLSISKVPNVGRAMGSVAVTPAAAAVPNWRTVLGAMLMPAPFIEAVVASSSVPCWTWAAAVVVLVPLITSVPAPVL